MSDTNRKEPMTRPRQYCSRSFRWEKLRLPRLALLVVLFLLPCQPLGAAGDGPRVLGHKPVGLNGLLFNLTMLADSNRSFDPSLKVDFLAGATVAPARC